ncbi:MFS family permease [Paraburkholderia sp. CI3]
MVGLSTAAQAGGGLAVVPLAGWIAARFGGRQVIAGALMKTVGHEAVVGVVLCAALAFLAAAWWERRRIALRAPS